MESARAERPVERASSPSFAAVEIAHTPAPNPEIVAAAIPAPPVIEAPSHHQAEATVEGVQEFHEEVGEEAHEEVQGQEEIEIHDEAPSAIETAEAAVEPEVASSTHFAEPAIEEPSISPAHAEEAIAEPVAHAPETVSAAPQAEAHEPQPAETFASAPISESIVRRNCSHRRFRSRCQQPQRPRRRRLHRRSHGICGNATRS